MHNDCYWWTDVGTQSLSWDFHDSHIRKKSKEMDTTGST